MINKKVNLDLVGLDGNAYSLLAHFSAQAKLEGWTKEEIAEIQYKAMSGDYSYLLSTLMDYCEPSEEEPE